MGSFPLFLKLEGRRVLLVGAGSAAAAKLRLLGSAGARINVVAEAPSPGLLAAIAGFRAQLIGDALAPAHLADVELVFGATGTEAGDRAVAEAARAAGKLVNIVDRPGLSDFTMPAIIDRGGIVVAVSTDGASPVLAQRVRAAIESVLPPGLGRLAQFAQRFRATVQARIADGSSRRRFWDQVLGGPIAAAVLAGDEGRAARELIRAANLREPTAETGRVSLVGAGPGDPELLTLRAARALREADVIVHDRLVDPAVLDYARRDARRMYVG
jgi:uroporphyrin-III C-methyltransferase/precorrin-2 dehydrogenase/sirohydrochlorin ferrochelatase